MLLASPENTTCLKKAIGVHRKCDEAVGISSRLVEVLEVLRLQETLSNFLII
jgi:hypothetical protein